MTKTKRSFIQRLIGKEDSEDVHQINYDTGYNSQMNKGLSINESESDDNNKKNEMNYNNPNFQPSQGSQNQSQSIPMNSAPQPQRSSAPEPAASAPRGGDNEWVADQEGQLTIDVYQTDTDIVIKSTIAGVKPEDLDVQINNDMVTIRGERKTEAEVREEDYYYQECYWGAFSRSIILPVDVQANKSEATMKNGILTIRLPKADSAQSRKIQVRGY